MTVRQIITIGHDTLRQKARRVDSFDDKLRKLIDDMVETMDKASGVGLAAPQINVKKRIIVVRLPDDDEEYGELAGKLYEIVNPEIIRPSREIVEGIEACLSIPGYFGVVDRHVSAIIKGQDRNGKDIRIKAFDWHARVFQHEIDHLDGVLYVDHASEMWKAGEEPEWLREQQQPQAENEEN